MFQNFDFFISKVFEINIFFTNLWCFPQGYKIYLKSENGPIEVFLSESSIDTPLKQSPLKQTNTNVKSEPVLENSSRGLSTPAKKNILHPQKPDYKTPKKVYIVWFNLKLKLYSWFDVLHSSHC